MMKASLPQLRLARDSSRSNHAQLRPLTLQNFPAHIGELKSLAHFTHLNQFIHWQQNICQQIKIIPNTKKIQKGVDKQRENMYYVVFNMEDPGGFRLWSTF